MISLTAMKSQNLGKTRSLVVGIIVRKRVIAVGYKVMLLGEWQGVVPVELRANQNGEWGQTHLSISIFITSIASSGSLAMFLCVKSTVTPGC